MINMQRVQRIKVLIKAFFILMFILPIVLSLALFFKVMRLEQTIGEFGLNPAALAQTLPPGGADNTDAFPPGARAQSSAPQDSSIPSQTAPEESQTGETDESAPGTVADASAPDETQDSGEPGDAVSETASGIQPENTSGNGTQAGAAGAPGYLGAQQQGDPAPQGDIPYPTEPYDHPYTGGPEQPPEGWN
jgi:hypothetical protein